MDRIRDDVNTLMEALHPNEESESEQGRTVRTATNIPGMAEAIRQQAQGRQIEVEYDPGSEQDSERYPGMSEDEDYGDRAQWMLEYRHIQDRERQRGPIVADEEPEGEKEPMAQETTVPETEMWDNESFTRTAFTGATGSAPSESHLEEGTTTRRRRTESRGV